MDLPNLLKKEKYENHVIIINRNLLILSSIVWGRYRKLTIIARPQRQPPINVAPVKDRFCYKRTKPRTFLDAWKLQKNLFKNSPFSENKTISDDHVDFTNLERESILGICWEHKNEYREFDKKSEP